MDFSKLNNRFDQYGWLGFWRILVIWIAVNSIILTMPAMAQVVGYGGSGLGQRDATASLPGLSAGVAVGNNAPMITNIQGLTGAKTSRPILLKQDAKSNLDATEKKNDKAALVEVTNEFQDFIFQSTGKKLLMYGHNLFENTPDTFAPVENIPVASDYLIGPGDEIVIKAWGKVDIDYVAEVSRNGTINLPKVGTINVAGIRYQQLQTHIRNSIARVFRNFELSVTLGNLRSIQVFVVGQARRPGIYTVSSLSTLVNTLFASGGPSINGSLRQIQVKRNGKLATEFDMYDLLLKGDKTRDITLLPGDVINILPAGPMVAVSGSVNNPAIYELRKDRDTTLASLIELAGGFTSTAAGQKVKVERIAERKVRKVEEFELDKSGLERNIKDGDLVQVNAIKGQFDNAVTLKGNVAEPGRYPWRLGMRIKDLIPNKDALITASYWEKQNQSFGTSRIKDESQLKGKDEELSRAQEESTQKTRVEGPHRSRDDGQNPEREEVKAKFINSNGEINWDYALIERLNKEDLTNTLIPFNLGKAIQDGESPENHQLQPGDVITIFSKENIQVPISKRGIYVQLEGEINGAGIYRILPGETLRQLIERVGGLTPGAYLFGAELNRKTVREMQKKRLQTMADRMESEIYRVLSAKQQVALSAEDATKAQMQAEAQNALVLKLRNAEVTGRVVLEIPPQHADIKDIPDIALEDGDRFMIPSKPSTVSVMGMVYNGNAFVYRPGKVVSDYLELAGGPTRDADESRIYLLRSDGSVTNIKKSNTILGYFSGSFGGSEGAEIMPGDTVVVPELLDRFAFTKELKDWSQILYQFALGVAGIKLLNL